MMAPSARVGGLQGASGRFDRRGFGVDHLGIMVAAVGWVSLVILWQAAPAIGRWAAGRPVMMSMIVGLLALLMAMAMMVPTVMPTIRFVALSGLPRRRQRGPVWFVVGYLSVWTVVTLALTVALETLTAIAGAAPALAAVAVFAVALQCSRYKRRSLGRCRRTASISISGRQADVDCLAFGSRIALDCVAGCIGLMSVAIASGHSLLAMGAIGAVILRERAALRFKPSLGIAVIGLVTASALLSSIFAEPSWALASSGSNDAIAPWICLIP